MSSGGRSGASRRSPPAGGWTLSGKSCIFPSGHFTEFMPTSSRGPGTSTFPPTRSATRTGTPPHLRLKVPQRCSHVWAPTTWHTSSGQSRTPPYQCDEPLTLSATAADIECEAVLRPISSIGCDATTPTSHCADPLDLYTTTDRYLQQRRLRDRRGSTTGWARRPREDVIEHTRASDRRRASSPRSDGKPPSTHPTRCLCALDAARMLAPAVQGTGSDR